MTKTRGTCRILIVQKFSSLGGAQSSLVHVLEGLDRTRFEPYVVVSNTGWLTTQLDRLKVPWSLERFGHWGNPAYGLHQLMLVFRLHRLIRDRGIQLVHANEHWIAPPCRWAARLARVPVICHFRTGLEDLTERRIRKYGYGKFDRVLLVAEVLRAALSQHVSEPARLLVIRDGVVAEPQPPADWSRRATRVVVNVGAIYEVKGQAIILEKSMPWLKASRKHFLIFVGGIRKAPEYVEDMKRLVAEQRLTRQVLFLGSREDVPRLLRAADALVAYSTVEGVPRVVMEAMIAGRPVIVSNTLGMSEAVTDGESGRVINFDDEANPFRQALNELSTDPPQWAEMGRRARERAWRHFSAKAMCDSIQMVYAELTDQPSHA